MLTVTNGFPVVKVVVAWSLLKILQLPKSAQGCFNALIGIA
jgi:hypothetical protein